ncbi:MAG: ECF transporter S component [Eubacteriales bacterium]
MSKGNEKRTLIIKKLVYSAMFLAIALVLPFLTGGIPQIGKALCPMHLPVLLCGFICGAQYGAVVGFTAPLLRSAIFHMPPLFTAIPMAFELMAYGLLAGLVYRLLPKKIPYVYLTLFISMVGGRLIWGLASFILAGIRGTEFSLAAFWAGAIANAIPGIIVQIVLIPIIFLALRRAKLTLNEQSLSQ